MLNFFAMFKTFVIYLFLISATLGKQILIITQLKNDTEVPIRSSLVTASLGDTVSFRCKLIENDAKEELGIKWTATSFNKPKFAKDDSSTIVLSPLELNDAGVYTCACESRNVSDHVRLFVKPHRWNDFVNLSKLQREEILLFKELQKPPVVFTEDFQTVPNFHHIPDLPPIDISKMNFPNPDEYEPKTINTYRTFKQSVYIVPVTILIILSLVRLCYHLGNRSRVPWQQLTTPTCNHQICSHRRRTNPSAACFLTRLDNRLSVLIIRTVAGNESASNQAEGQNDAPPAYNDVNAGDSPPTYSEAVENLNGTPCSDDTTNSSAQRSGRLA